MDLDILLYDALVSDEPGLVLPRPDLVRRAYMLKPMVDLAPDLMHPTLGKTMREIWGASELKWHELVETTIA
jgi:2-amino-4-hydroxy-6-hydroxymethyldihydropteridine diphosphokinase